MDCTACEMRKDLLCECVCVGVGWLRETETTRKGSEEEGAGARKERDWTVQILGISTRSSEGE